jgi:(p)ppGpp synthase/HD superfamily hydrolase
MNLIKVEQAICFLVDTVRQSGHNHKPVIFHSLLVGFKLLELQQPEEVVIAGFLHDIIEDTDCRLKEVENRFGQRVAMLVEALTSEKSPKNFRARTRESLNQVLKIGQAAVMIRLVDAFDNLPHTIKVDNPKKRSAVLWKHSLLIEKFRPFVGREPVYQNYVKLYQKLTKSGQPAEHTRDSI